MKKPVRLLLLGSALVAALLVAAVGLALHSGVQTWAARRALADHPELNVTIGQVSGGFQNVALNDLRVEQDSAVLTLPAMTAEFSVIDAGLNERVNVRGLVAKGWTLDLTRFQFAAVPLPPAAAGAVVAALPAAVVQSFQGIFAQAALPFDLTLDGVALEGDVILPPTPGVSSGRAHVVVEGGGVAAGHEGGFTVKVAVALVGNDLPVNTLNVSGRFSATMDTPRTFSALSTRAEAMAVGAQFPQGVKLVASLSATRSAAGERYGISLSDGTRTLAGLTANLPTATRHLAGEWTADVRHTDLAPFTLGRPLPKFSVTGAGAIDLETTTGDAHASGKITGSVDDLAVVRSELAVVGPLGLRAEFDLTRQGESLRVDRLTADLGGAEPVATARSLQAFDFNLRSGELKVADPAAELLDLNLRGLPLAWVQPFIRDLTVTGGGLHGRFVAAASQGGFALRSSTPLTAAGISVAADGRLLIRGVDLTATPAATFTPAGWQIEFAPLTLAEGGKPMVTLEARAGQLPGPGQPVKATGKFFAHLPALFNQPALSGLLVLEAGEGTVDFAASLGPKSEIQAKLALTNLAAGAKAGAEKLPEISAEIRADFGGGGPITVNVPVSLTQADRVSDLSLSGTLTPGKLGLMLDARAGSELFRVEDVQLLAALLPPAGPVALGADRVVAPPWAGVNGQLALALRKVVVSESLEFTDVTGSVRLDAGSAKLVNVRAGLGEGADGRLSGDVTFDAKAAVPYALVAEVAVNEFDPAGWFRAANPGQPPIVEGRFSVASRLVGNAATLGGFASAARGDLQLSSKGGVFRGLPVSYAAKVESAGRLAAGAAAISSLIGSVTGKKDDNDVANKAQAATEFSRLLGAVAYDQLNVVLSRDASLNTELKDFTLIAPEMRIYGGGQTWYRPGAGLLDQAVALEFKLRARGRTADLMKYLGTLEPAVDDLGYAGCALPLKVTGTLGRPDTGELNSRLATLALEKSGMTEKASELFNRLFGGGK